MEDADRPRRQRFALRRPIADAQQLDPGLDLRGQDAADRPGAVDRVDVAPEHALDVRRAGRSVHLRGAPLLGVRLEGDLAGARVDVLAGDDRGGDLVEPALRLDLAGEVLGVLLARLVAVAGAPSAVWPLLDVGHGSSDGGCCGSEGAALPAALLADEPSYVAHGGDEVAADLEELRPDAALAPPAHRVDRHPQDLSDLGQCQQLFGIALGKRDVGGGHGHGTYLLVVGSGIDEKQRPHDCFGHLWVSVGGRFDC